MTRRQVLHKGAALVALGLFGFKHAFSKQSSSLKLFIDRKEKSNACMRGYLLTQLNSEPKPTVACYILEQPPRNNIPYISAIPAGTYTVKVRKDGTLGWRLELINVPGRTNVEIHLGNFPKDTVGCLLPGKEAGANQCSVLKSGQAMAELQTLFAVFGDSAVTQISIRDIS